MWQFLRWLFHPKKCAELVEVVSVFPTHFNEVASSSSKMLTHFLVVPVVKIDVLLFVVVGIMVAVCQFSAMAFGAGDQRLLDQTIKPNVAILSGCEDEFAAWILFVQLFVDERPWPIFEKIMVAYSFVNSSEVAPYSEVFEELSI